MWKEQVGSAGCLFNGDARCKSCMTPKDSGHSMRVGAARSQGRMTMQGALSDRGVARKAGLSSGDSHASFNPYKHHDRVLDVIALGRGH